MKKILAGLGGLIFALAAVVVFRAATLKSQIPTVVRVTPPAFDQTAAAARLGRALQFRTESLIGTIADGGAAFDEFHRFLEASYPRVHAALKRETVNRFSLLYTWPGKTPTLKPVLLMCHQDVVPISPGTEPDWTHAPWRGEIADGFVWGRGALDVKSGLLGQLEAVELLLAEGFQPERTILFAFGHDEEIGGTQGAALIARLLAKRGVTLECVIDEGGFVTEGVLPFAPGPVAVIGVAEKGYASVNLTARVAGGHSSVPPRDSAIGALSRAIVALETHPYPADLTHVLRLYERITPEMAFAPRCVMANAWLFGPLLERQLAAKPTTNALIRTTTAPTIIRGGNKENVLPPEAHATVNFRLLPGETTAGVLARVRQIVSDPLVSADLGTRFHSEPSPVSGTDTAGYRAIERTIYEVMPEKNGIVSPYLVIGGTDSRHFAALTPNIYRFLFERIGPDDLKRAHGTNERISVKNYAEVIQFYHRLMQNFQQM